MTEQRRPGRDAPALTRLEIVPQPEPHQPFSFLVVGDTDTPTTGPAELAQALAALMAEQVTDWDFLLHTGDIVYPLGDYQTYHHSFLRPYGFLLNGVPKTSALAERDLVFRKPFLPVPGNHDYAQTRGLSGRLRAIATPLCNLLRRHLNLDLGCYGGEGGRAYGRLFLAEPGQPGPGQEPGLRYEPGRFTRLPHRFYQYRYGCADFFALDSNSWCCSASAPHFDSAQLDWLKQSLIASHQDPAVALRIIYLHHSPYTTEETRWQQSETLYVRRHLRAVFDQVAAILSQSGRTAPIVNLTLSGHAHCFEHLQTEKTGHADSFLNWIVCGGSGDSIRRQRSGGSELLEKLVYQGRPHPEIVAKSLCYAGVEGDRQSRQYSHSLLRIDIDPLAACPIKITPILLRQTGHQWQNQALAPILISAPQQARPLLGK